MHTKYYLVLQVLYLFASTIATTWPRPDNSYTGEGAFMSRHYARVEGNRHAPAGMGGFSNDDGLMVYRIVVDKFRRLTVNIIAKISPTTLVNLFGSSCWMILIENK